MRKTDICKRGHDKRATGVHDRTCKRCLEFTMWTGHIATYGLDRPAWSRMVERANGKCEICLRVFRGTRDCNIDHNHSTGAVRGLLCSPCNHKLMVIDRPAFVEAAMRYIQGAI